MFSITWRFRSKTTQGLSACRGCWLLFYALEVYAILKVLDKHQQNPDAAVCRVILQNCSPNGAHAWSIFLAISHQICMQAYALRGLSTLPKRMLPRLQPFQTLLQAIGLNPRPSMGKAKAAEATAAPTRYRFRRSEILSLYILSTNCLHAALHCSLHQIYDFLLTIWPGLQCIYWHDISCSHFWQQTNSLLKTLSRMMLGFPT